MSLKEAVMGIITDIDSDTTEYQPDTNYDGAEIVAVLRGHARALRAAVKASEAPDTRITELPHDR